MHLKVDILYVNMIEDRITNDPSLYMKFYRQNLEISVSSTSWLKSSLFALLSNVRYVNQSP